jgi:hypothetical protein
MRLMTMLRIVLILNVLTMLLQALFAGRMLGGDDQSTNLHEFTAKALVLLTASQIVLAILLRLRRGCPTWVPAAGGVLLAAEVLEFALGHFHSVALHVPLGLAIFGGAIRQLLWSLQEARQASELRV